MQPLYVWAFGIFKRQLIDTRTTAPHKNGIRMPENSVMACIVYVSWEAVFTPENISVLFPAGCIPAAKERALIGLSGRGIKTRKRSFDRAPLADSPILVNDKHKRIFLGEIEALRND